MSQIDYPDYDKFYEELALDNGNYSDYLEEIAPDNRYSQTGLREDEVHKLTEDINNPLPPVEPSE